MSRFLFGIVVGVIATIVVFERQYLRSPAVPKASVAIKRDPEQIYGRNTFNINVDVERFPSAGHDQHFLNTLFERQENLARKLQQRIEQAGLHHEPICPVILSVFGMLLERDSGAWDVAIKVSTTVTTRATKVYPSWDGTSYKVSRPTMLEAQSDLEKVLTEQLEQFLLYYGKAWP
jgi:hypothetical protein